MAEAARTETRWVVITGAACSGKTSVIEAISQRGYTTQKEVARSFFEQVASNTPHQSSTRASRQTQLSLIDAKREVEHALDPKKLIFLDRALPDSIAYWSYYGYENSEIEKSCDIYRYAAVFLLESLPYVNDDIRIEAEQDRIQLSSLIREIYSRLGYRVIMVPARPGGADAGIASRVTTILETTRSLGVVDE